MGKLRVKWLKTGAFPLHIPVLLIIGGAGGAGNNDIMVWLEHSEHCMCVRWRGGLQCAVYRTI